VSTLAERCDYSIEILRLARGERKRDGDLFAKNLTEVKTGACAGEFKLKGECLRDALLTAE
jgi:hypothetical protein